MGHRALPQRSGLTRLWLSGAHFVESSGDGRFDSPLPILARAESAESKARLRAQTETAAKLGIFGAPSFVAGSELFWGNDRLEQALAWSAKHADQS